MNQFRKKHLLKVENQNPSSFYKAEFKIWNEQLDTLYQTKYYATSSLTPGSITAYFNHNAQTSSAIFNEAQSVNIAMRDTLINYINKATESIDIAIYNSFGNSPNTLIAGALNDAHNSGIQVRVIYDQSTSSTMINQLNSNIPVLYRPENDPGIMHHKFLIVDAEHSDATKAFVWSGSTNWTTGQLIGPDKNNVIIIQDQTLAQTFQMEFEEMWGGDSYYPDFTNLKFGEDKSANTPTDFVIDGVEVTCFFSPTDDTEQEILNLINAANESLVVATMLITRANIAQALVDKYEENLTEFAVLLDDENYGGSQNDYLSSQLADDVFKEYYAQGIMHYKSMVIDQHSTNAAVLTGSHNWSYSAENINDENTLIIYDQDIANQYYQAIAFLFSEVGGSLATDSPEENNDRVFIYPNPAKDLLYIDLRNNASEELTFQLFDSQSRLVLEKKIKSTQANSPVDIADLKPGIYIGVVKSASKQFIQKIIINR
ncbi:MAG: phospholipase D-like domain-containing protein [Bacteroidota bacterium]